MAGVEIRGGGVSKSWVEEYVAAQVVIDYTAITDPAVNAAVTTAIVDNNGGVIITTTATGNAQTIQNPTAITTNKEFIVANNDTSTHSVTVNGVVIGVGEAQKFFWDGSSWLTLEAVSASQISFTPTGDIVATDVQTAITELDSEKMQGIAPAAITSFTGTISAATRTVTFSSAVDWALAKVGSTLIADGDTRIVVAIGASPTVTVDANTTWAGATVITSLQEPIAQMKQADGTVVGYINALGGQGWIGGLNDLQKGLMLDQDGDSGIIFSSDDAMSIIFNNIERVKMDAFNLNFSSAGNLLRNTAASATTPNIGPSNDANTGIGTAAPDQLSQIAGGVEAIRSIEANSVIYNVLNAVQQEAVTDATSNGTTTISKAGENFNTTCIAGDTVLIWGGTTTADYGVYSIVTVTSDTALVLNTALSGSVADMDFYVFRGGTITTGSTIHQGPNIIKAVDESGLGNRLTIGLDETARTMVICDAGDVDTDFGFTPANDARIILMRAEGDRPAIIANENGAIVLNTEYALRMNSNDGIQLNIQDNQTNTDAITFQTGVGIGLTDTDGEQSMVYIEPKINQSGTAAYNGLKIDVTETALGDGSTGDGNNLLNLQVASDTKAKISNEGAISAKIATITQPATDTLTELECSGTQISNYGQSAENTQTLPTAAAGLNGVVVIGTAGTGAFHLKAGATDKIYLDGIAMADAEKVSLATPSIGDFFSFTAFQTGAAAYDWIIRTGEGVIANGGA